MTAADGERADLDRNYNLRAAVPDFEVFFDRYQARSAEVRHQLRDRVRLGLRYGPGPRQMLDLFLPDTPAPPLLVFIHGGYWHTQERVNFSFVAAPLVAAGAAVAVLGYDLAPAVDMDRLVRGVYRGIGWLWARAPDLGLDQQRIFLAGHSAGGHLAALALASDALPAAAIAGVCAISGIFDLDPIRRCYLNDVLALTPEQVRCWSAIRRVPRPDHRVLIAVGAAETPAFLDQSARYATWLRRHGSAVQHEIVPDAHHFAIIDGLADPDGPLTRLICNLVRT